MSQLKFAGVCLILSACCMAASAVPLSSIDVGDAYYLHRDLDDNVLVTVVSIDPASKRIKIRYQADGSVDWVSAGQLMTKTQSDAEEMRAANEFLAAMSCAITPNDPSCREADWKPGSPHPRVPDVVAGSAAGKWRPAPGFRWENPDRFGPVVWAPGEAHPEFAHVIASDTTRRWHPEPGYIWVTPGKLGPVRWDEGREHPSYPHVYSASQEGVWVPAAGYGWAVPSKPQTLGAVVWRPGLEHPRFKSVLADRDPGNWKPAAGYHWVNAASPDLTVVRD